MFMILLIHLSRSTFVGPESFTIENIVEITKSDRLNAIPILFIMQEKARYTGQNQLINDRDKVGAISKYSHQSSVGYIFTKWSNDETYSGTGMLVFNIEGLP